MKKTWLSLLLVLAMILSPVTMYTVNDTTLNVEKIAETKDADVVLEENDMIMGSLANAELQTTSNNTESVELMQTKSDRMSNSIVETLKETTVEKSNLDEQEENPGLVVGQWESQEHELAGNLAAVPTAENASEVAKKVYKKYVPDFSAAQIVPNGTYVIMGGRNDGSNNTTSAITRTETVAFTNYTDLVYTPNVTIVNDVITQEYPNTEWDVTYDAVSGTYTFVAPEGGKYLAIYDDDAPEGAVSATTSRQIVILQNTNVSGSVSIGGKDILDGNTGYLNHRNNPGTWSGTDIGSAWILYAKKYAVLDSALQTATAGVKDEGLYTPTSWASYQSALDAAKEVFATEGEVLTAYNALAAAVNSLEEIDLPEGITTTTKGDHYVLVKQAVDSTTVEPGVYMLVNSRFYKAMLGEDTPNTITSNGRTYGDLLEKIKVGKTSTGQEYGGDYQNNNYETQHPTEIYVEKSWNGVSVEWEISANADGTYNLKNVSNGKYFSMPENGKGIVQETPIATTITGKSSHGGETYNGSVLVQQGDLYLNLFGGTGGYFGGYNGNNDGGNAIYLYKKVLRTQTYDAITTELQNLVDGYKAENLQKADYKAETWAPYSQALVAAETLLGQSHAFVTVDEAVADKAKVDAAYQTLKTAKENLVQVLTLPNGKLPLEYLYEVICQANGGQFLYSEEVYTPASGMAYRDALKKARGTFASDDEAMAALAELEAAVRGLETIADSCFPEIQWKATIDANRTSGDTTQSNFVPNVSYLNTSNLQIGEITYNAWEALPWKWSAIPRLVNDEDEKEENVWSQHSGNGMWTRTFDAASTNGDWTQADVYKISGTFVWPENYDLHKTTVVLDSKNDFFYRDIYEYISDKNNGISDYFPLSQVIPVNDDVYVVVWAGKEENKPTLPKYDTEGNVIDDGINNYLAFWTGTSGKGYWTENGTTRDDWGRNEPATYIAWNLQGERAFRNSYPNKVGTGATKADGSAYTNGDVVALSADAQKYLSHTDGWYALTDTTAINSVLRTNYPNGIPAGTEVHIDLYVMNNSGEGMIDELEIELFKEKETETIVTVNYYLNEVTTDGFLGSETLLNQKYGTKITILPGTGAGQLNSYKAQAIYDAGYKDVTDGVQLNELIVTEGAANVVNVLYTVKNEQIVYLKADNGTYAYTGEAHELNKVTVTENGYDNEATPVDGAPGTYTLPDGNVIAGVSAVVSKVDPGIYENNFSTGDITITNTAGNDITNTYKIVKIPGELTITYKAEEATKVYDFGETNVYDLATVLNPIESKAEAKVNNQAATTISYEPTSVNASEKGEVTLVFAGGYTVKKTVDFVPASNVLYGEKFMTKADSSVWTTEGTAAKYTVNDNETTAYGYTGVIAENAHSNNSAYKAVLDVNGNSGIKGLTAKTDALTFEFTGTGFDLYSACGPDTGMVIVRVENSAKKVVASYLVDTYFTGDTGTNKIIDAAGKDVIDYQIPIVRKLGLGYDTYTVTVYGYLVNTAGALATYGMEDAAIPTEDIVMTALEDLGLEDVDVSDMEIAYMSDDSVLNGGMGNVAAESGFGAFALTREGEANTATPAKDSAASVYVDGFRVYQPLNKVDAYSAKEQNTTYHSVYDFIKTSVNDLTENAMLYIEYDGNTGAASIADYKIQGPQNEVYLTAGNAVAFALDNYNEGDVVQIGAKAVIAGAKLSSDNGTNSTSLHATEMYYDVNVQTINGIKCVVIKNSGTAGVLALSGLKVSSNIGIYASGEVGKQIIDGMNGAEDVETVFEITTAESVQCDRRFTVSVETSTDVKSVELQLPNGAKVTMTAYNAQAVASGTVKTYKYSQSIAAHSDWVSWTDEGKTEGTYTVTVTALNAAGEKIGETAIVPVKVVK